MKQMTATELQAWLARADGARPQLLDVREPWEFALGSLAGSVHVPMRAIPASLDRLDRDRPVVCICHHGARSMQVAMFLEYNGFREVINLAGGVDAWSRDVDPSIPLY